MFMFLFIFCESFENVQPQNCRNAFFVCLFIFHWAHKCVISSFAHITKRNRTMCELNDDLKIIGNGCAFNRKELSKR